MPDPVLGRPRAETFILCRDQNTPVPTGVELTELAEPARIYLLVRCAACGGEHLWSVEDALQPL